MKFSSSTPLRRGRLFTAGILSLLCFLLGTASTLAISSSRAPRLILVTAPSIAANGLIEVSIVAENASTLGGYQASILYDTATVELGGADFATTDLAKNGNDVRPLGPVERPEGVVFGAYTCITSDCYDPAQARWLDIIPQGRMEVGHLTFVPTTEGVVELRLTDIELVQPNGQRIAVQPPTPVKVQVGTATTQLPAPTIPSQLTSPVTKPSPATDYDLSGNGWVEYADLASVAHAWESNQGSSHTACDIVVETLYDVSGEGCITVADIQALAAHYSKAQPSIADRSAAAVSTTFTVNTTSDVGDTTPGDGICANPQGFCSLRAAIAESNAISGSNIILFDIPGVGPHTIQLEKALPTINDTTGGITVDGYSQPGAVPNSDATVSNAVIQIQIRGNGWQNFNGFNVVSANNSIRGVATFNFNRSFYLYQLAANNNTIEGNFIGTDATGTFAFTEFGLPGAQGVRLDNGANHNHIGGPAPASRNIIAGNAHDGIGMWHNNTDYNIIQGNIIGLAPDGSRALPNVHYGIDHNFGPSYNVTGGTGIGERNVVSGNLLTAIEISHDPSTNYNQIVGNYVGLTPYGTASNYSANGWWGIMLKDRVDHNLVTHNYVGQNGRGGIYLFNLNDCCITHSTVQDNVVGMDVNNAPAGNGDFGIKIITSDSTIGPNNVVAYNPIGIQVTVNSSDRNRITQNRTFNNIGLGIDLQPNGVNPNDPGDVDTGPNEGQNFPVLNTATPYQVTGTSCAGCTIELFVADSTTAGAYGEGQTYLASVVADASGNFVALISGVSIGQYVTSTATDPTGNTSEFSLNRQVVAGTPPTIPPITFNPVADAYVLATNPTKNYGPEWRIGAEAAPDRRAYVRFTVAGLDYTVTQATLRFYSFDASSAGIDVREVSDNTWTENAITYNTAPVVGNIIGSSGSMAASSWVEIDVTPYITGNGTYNLALTTNANLQRFVSREGVNPPQLVIEQVVTP